MFLPLLIAVATLTSTGYVNDFASLLSPAVREELNSQLTVFAQAYGSEVVVATVPEIGTDETIETYAVKLFEQWKIGRAEEDDGVLLLISRDDREMKIEVGYGLEGAITDVESSRIIREILTPAFQAGNYDQGVRDAVARILEDIRAEELPSPVAQKIGSWLAPFGWVIFILLFNILAATRSWWLGGAIGGVVALIFFQTIIGFGIAVVLGLLIDYLLSRTRGPGGRPPFIGGFGGGHGGGGGFGGFGGGSSGGGGASGRW